MDFRFTPEQERLRLQVRSLAERILAPIAYEADESNGISEEVTRALAGEGLFRYVLPKEYGGNGIQVTNVCIIREELAKVCGQADNTFAMQGLGSYPITLGGSEELKRRYLPKVATGEYLATFALTEPDSGSDVAGMKTSARLEGGHYVINGSKKFISQGGHAHFYCTFVKTDPSQGSRGISAFVIDAGTPGFDASQKLDLLAAHPAGVPTFKDVRVPPSQLLGKPGEGMKIALSTLDVFRTTVAACTLGMAEAAYAAALKFAGERIAFGAPIANLQGIQFKLAEMATSIEAARFLTYHAAWLKDSGTPQVITEASMAKLFASEMAQKVVDEALQIHGGQGLVKGTITEKLYRQVRMPRIYEGTSEVLKVTIARQLIKQASLEGTSG